MFKHNIINPAKKPESFGNRHTAPGILSNVRPSLGIVYHDGERKSQCFRADNKLYFLTHPHSFPINKVKEFKFDFGDTKHPGFVTAKLMWGGGEGPDAKKMQRVWSGSDVDLWSSNINLPGIPCLKLAHAPPSVGAELLFQSQGNVKKDGLHIANGKVKKVEGPLVYHDLPTEEGDCGGVAVFANAPRTVALIHCYGTVGNSNELNNAGISTHLFRSAPSSQSSV